MLRPQRGAIGLELEKKGLYQNATALCECVCGCVFISVFMCLIVHWGGLRAETFLEAPMYNVQVCTCVLV